MNDTWDLVYNYFRHTDNYLTNHHLDSFNNFIEEKIPQTIQQYNPQYIYKEFNKELNDYKYTTKIYYGGKDGSKIYVGKPIALNSDKQTQLYPNEARLRNLTYGSSLFCDIYIEYSINKSDTDEDNNIEVHNVTYEKVNIGKIPIMLQSHLCSTNGATNKMLQEMGECPYDQGGYFIVDGLEKVIVSHERKAENKLYIVTTNDALYNFSAQIKSVPNDSFKYARTTAININSRNDEITVRLPMIHTQIPLFILFRLLGINSDKEILQYILYELDSKKAKLFMEHLRPSLEASVYVNDKMSAIKYLTQLTQGKTTSHLLDNISTDLFPHVGDNYIHKAYYLGYVVNKLLEVKLGIRDPTDRDSFEFKRVDLSGFLLANLFRESFKQLQRDIRIAIDSEYRFNGNEYQDSKYKNIINQANFNKIFNFNVITDTFNKAFKMGTILNKKGLIQTMNRLSWPGTMSHLRRINTLGDMIMIGQRKLHGTQFGMICCAETPDGGNIGIKKHLTMTAQVTFGCSPQPIIDLLDDLDLVPLEYVIPEYIFNKVKVFVNGKWVGVHNEPNKLYNDLLNYKRNSLINIYTSIVFDYQNFEIRILTDGGRLCRPLAIVDNNKPLVTETIIKNAKNDKLTWNNLIGGSMNKNFNKYSCKYIKTKNSYEELLKTRSFIEYLDVDEFNSIMLANNINDLANEDYNYTHMELHPSLILGALGFTLPYCNSSPHPRNVYGTGQTKQSVGIFALNFRNRMDGSANVLSYAQKPLISSKLSDYVFSNQLPTGMNAIVAIGCYSGYNQEDSIIINKSAIERGLFNGFTFKTFETFEMFDSKNSVEHIIGKIPDDSKVKKELNYNNLNEDGIVNEGAFVNGNDVLIGKYIQNDEGEVFDDCVSLKEDTDGVVDKVFIDYMNTHKHRICKVRISNKRNPVLGDKFASRHGQKGTIGMVLRQEDMPYTKDGITPDIIVNPHAFPSRMTLGQFIEVIQGKICLDMGFFADSTPFTDIDNDDISDILENKCGFCKKGDEVMYGGILGKQLDSKIYIGPTYYQRLKHMVKDKINSRNTGKYTLKTKQPPSGRSLGGGLRIGEMERDALLAHGVMGFLKESMYDRSDKYQYNISDVSGMVAISNHDKNRFIDPNADGPLVFDSNMNLTNYNSQDSSIVPIKVPYNTKMLTQECEAMGIAIRLVPESNKKYEELNISSEKFIPQINKKKEKVSMKQKEKNKFDSYNIPILDNKFKLTNAFVNKHLMTPLTEFELNQFLKKVNEATDDSKNLIKTNEKIIVTKLENNQFLISKEMNPSGILLSPNNINNYQNDLEVGSKVDLSSLFESEYPSYGYNYYDYDYKPNDYYPQSPSYAPPPDSPSYAPPPDSPSYKPYGDIDIVSFDFPPSPDYAPPKSDEESFTFDIKETNEPVKFEPSPKFEPVSEDDNKVEVTKLGIEPEIKVVKTENKPEPEENIPESVVSDNQTIKIEPINLDLEPINLDILELPEVNDFSQNVSAAPEPELKIDDINLLDNIKEI